MSEFVSGHESKSLEKLQLLNFSFITRPNRVRPIDAERIMAIDSLSPEERVIDVSYYAVELSTSRLKPFDLAHSRLGEIEPGTDDAIEIIDDVIIAEAVRAEIVESLQSYSSELHDIIAKKTAEFTPDNVGWLKAIRRMRDAVDPQKRISQPTGRICEAVARLTIARERGIKITSQEITDPPV